MCLSPYNEIGEEDIGTYVSFGLDKLEKYFPEGVMFGDYTQNIIG